MWFRRENSYFTDFSFLKRRKSEIHLSHNSADSWFLTNEAYGLSEDCLYKQNFDEPLVKLFVEAVSKEVDETPLNYNQSIRHVGVRPFKRE